MKRTQNSGNIIEKYPDFRVSLPRIIFRDSTCRLRRGWGANYHFAQYFNKSKTDHRCYRHRDWNLYEALMMLALGIIVSGAQPGAPDIFVLGEVCALPSALHS